MPSKYIKRGYKNRKFPSGKLHYKWLSGVVSRSVKIRRAKKILGIKDVRSMGCERCDKRARQISFKEEYLEAQVFEAPSMEDVIFLCMACKIRSDGRIKKLRTISRRSRKRKYISCINCKSKYSIGGGWRNGRCNKCSSYFDRKKKDRPPVDSVTKFIKQQRLKLSCKSCKRKFNKIQLKRRFVGLFCGSCYVRERRAEARKAGNKTKYKSAVIYNEKNILKRILSQLRSKTELRTSDIKKLNIKYDDIIKKLLPHPGKNYSIDHIVPIKSFDLSKNEQIEMAFLPENLRWLSGSRNAQKWKYIIIDDIPDGDKHVFDFVIKNNPDKCVFKTNEEIVLMNR